MMKKRPPTHGEVCRGLRPLLRMMLRLGCVKIRGLYEC